MKKYLIFCLLFVVILSGCSKKNKEAEKKKAYEDTETEVNLLFDHSSTFPHKLLDSPPEGSSPNIMNFLDEKECDDTYHVDEYHDKCCVTTIVLKSDRLNLYGITSGDEKSSIAEKLKNTNLELVSEEDSCLKYSVALLSLDFELTKDNTIEEIVASVYDPYIPDEQRKIY